MRGKSGISGLGFNSKVHNLMKYKKLIFPRFSGHLLTIQEVANAPIYAAQKDMAIYERFKIKTVNLSYQLALLDNPIVKSFFRR